MLEFSSGEYMYTVWEDGTTSVRVIDRDRARYGPIPREAEHDGVLYPVTSLRGCFCGCGSLEEAPAIPEGVTDMACCFCGCASLKKAPAIPGGVTDTARCFHGCGLREEGMPGAEACRFSPGERFRCPGGHVFRTQELRYGGLSLQSYEGPGGMVAVPEGVDRVAQEAFALCTQVTGVILPEGVRQIEWKAFCRSGIRSVSLPDTLLGIGELAFSLTPLESVDIPDQVTSVKARAFAQAARLKRARLPEGMADLEPGVFSGCVSLTEVALPKGLRYIRDGAFQSCGSLERIDLPGSVAAILPDAFRGCVSLREICLGDSVRTLGPGAFKDCASLEKLRIPEKLLMTNGNAFGNNGRMELTGPGSELGPIIDSLTEIYYHPVTEKAVIAEGVVKLPQICMLWAHYSVRILDLPKSLKYFSWYFLARMTALRQIVADRDSAAARIALLLEVECVDRQGRSFTLQPPVDPGAWITREDPEYGGLCLTGHRERAGATAQEGYVTVVVPDQIGGRPVTSVGAGLFDGCDYADAFYIPDSVRRIGSLAFAHNVFCKRQCAELFVRLPEQIQMAEDAFEDTRYTTRAAACRDMTRRLREMEAKTAGTAERTTDSALTAEAADDPYIGTGTSFPALQANIWQYFDRLGREERIRELTHAFTVSAGINGVGWAHVSITLDGRSAEFRISDIGPGPADFRRFAEGIADGERASFVWVSEPGAFRWRIQRRGGVFYVEPPLIGDGFFIARKDFLRAAEGLTDEWRSR